MTVILESVAKVIEAVFNSEVHHQDEVVFFDLHNGTFYTNVAVSSFELTDGEIHQSGIELILWFCDTEGERLDCQGLGLYDALVLRQILQRNICWGTLVVGNGDEDATYFALTRSIDVDEADLESALGHGESRFVRACSRLSTEWQLLAPVINGVAEGQLTDLKQIELFLDGDDVPN